CAPGTAATTRPGTVATADAVHQRHHHAHTTGRRAAHRARYDTTAIVLDAQQPPADAEYPARIPRHAGAGVAQPAAHGLLATGAGTLPGPLAGGGVCRPGGAGIAVAPAQHQDTAESIASGSRFPETGFAATHAARP